MIVFTIYLTVGAVIGFAMLRTVLNALEDEELKDDPELDSVKDMINRWGLQQFVISMFIVITLLWAPVMIHDFLANKIEE